LQVACARIYSAIHSGFASKASGEFNTKLQEEFTAKIEQLLTEKAAEQAAPATITAIEPGQ
jgi:hypothetical protein